MGLFAARCAIQPLLFRNLTNVLSIDVVTFTVLPCHKVKPKYSPLTIVSRNTQMGVFTSKRCINTSTALGMAKNYYNILGIPENSNQKQIKDAYYKLAMIHHPDKNQGIHTQRFREIKEAYDVLSNDSSRKNYDNSSSNSYQSTSDWTSNSSYGRYKHYEEYKTKNRTEYRQSKGEYNAYNYSHLKPFNVFINVVKVPKNIFKTQIDMMLLTFITNKTLKLILFHLFQFIWTQVLKNVNYNVLISSNSTNTLLEDFIKNVLTNTKIRIELTELEAIKGKSIRVQVNNDEKVLIVKIPRGVKKDQSFYLFYLLDDDDNAQHKI